MKNNIDGRSIKRDVLEAYRLRAIKLRNEQGYSVTQISEIFGVHYNSVSRWFVNYRKGGKNKLLSRKAKGAARTLQAGHFKFLEKTLAQPATDFGFITPLWNCNYTRILLKKQLGIVLDRTTIWRYLVKMGLSFQKPEKRYTQQDQTLVKKWIDKTWPIIQRWASKNKAVLYFEDESGISLTPVIGKTWAPKGKTPIIRISGKRGGILAMSAISPSGRMCFRLEKRRVNADVMIEFLQQICQLHPRKKVGVIMDQAPCHTAKKITDYVDASNNIQIFYLPPYSPELNPDEKVWRHMKHVELKNHLHQDKESLAKSVVRALRKMRKKKLAKSFFENYLT